MNRQTPTRRPPCDASTERLRALELERRLELALATLREQDADLSALLAAHGLEAEAAEMRRRNGSRPEPLPEENGRLVDAPHPAQRLNEPPEVRLRGRRAKGASHAASIGIAGPRIRLWA